MSSQGVSDKEDALRAAGEKLMAELCREFPQFEKPWKEHLADWNGEPAGAYNDISVFAHFIVTQIFEGRQHEEAKRAFVLLDRLFAGGTEETRDLIGIGFIEDVANISSWRMDGRAAILPLLTPLLLMVWQEIDRQWTGHASLMDVLKSEARNPQATRTWAQLLDLPTQP